MGDHGLRFAPQERRQEPVVGKEGNDQQEDHDHEPDDRQLVAHKAPGGIAIEAALGQHACRGAGGQFELRCGHGTNFPLAIAHARIQE